MAELRTFNSERIYRAVDQVEWEAGDIDDLHLDDSLFYLKSEADKLIEEKDKEIQRLEDLCESYRVDCEIQTWRGLSHDIEDSLAGRI